MITRYVLHIRDGTYALQASISDYLELSLSKRVNEVGRCEFILPARHDALTFIRHGSIVEVIRVLQYGLETVEYREFQGFVRRFEERTEAGMSYTIISCSCPLDILNHRVNAFYAETNGRSLYTNMPVETIMKQFVNVNAGPAATVASGRLRHGVIPGFTIAPDQGRGEVTSWANAWKTVLPDLQEMSEAFQYDFTLELNPDMTLEFEVYPLHTGEDRRADFIFSLDNGNMANPVYTWDTQGERSVVIAASDGQAGNRRVIVMSGVRYSESNNREVYSDARHIQVYVGPLKKNAERKLEEVLPVETFSFDVLQTPSTKYGVEYQMGDVVRTRYRDKEYQQKVQGVDISYTTQDLEKINVLLKTVDIAPIPDPEPEPEPEPELPGWRVTQQLGEESTILALVRLNSTTLLAGTEPLGVVYRSTTNGLTWQETTRIASETSVHCFLVLSDGSILAGTSNARIYRSTDSGTSWNLVQRLGTEFSTNTLVNLGDGVLVAGTGTAARMYRSTNNGSSWSFVQRLGTQAVARGLVHLGDGIVLAGTAATGQIYRSTNGGTSWSYIQRLGTSNAIWATIHVEGTIVLAGTNRGNIYRSEDGGLTWDLAQNTGEFRDVLSFTSIGNGGVLAGVSNPAEIYYSNDYGSTWTSVQTLGEELSVWSLVSDENGIVIAGTGDNGNVYRSDRNGIEL